MGVGGWFARARGRMDFAVAAIVFTVPDKRLKEMDVRTGPCVPTRGRKRPLAGVTRQLIGHRPEYWEWLYTALTSRPADGRLQLLEQVDKGSLFRFADDFVDAMASANRELVALGDADRARGDSDFTTFMRRNEKIQGAWRDAGPWPKTNNKPWTFTSEMLWAGDAQEKRQSLYLWHGPYVQEHRVVRGKGKYPDAG